MIYLLLLVFNIVINIANAAKRKEMLTFIRLCIDNLRLFSRSLLMSFVILIFSNCHSIDKYFQNRTKDIVDIPVIGVEENIYGISAWFWCFGGGIQHGRNGLGLGIRNGVVGYYKTGGRGGRIYLSTYENSDLVLDQGNSLIVMNSNSHIPKEDEPRNHKKSFSKFNTNVIFPLGFGSERGSSSGIESRWCESPVSVEVSIGIHYGIRLGMNFSEIFDFLTGVILIDPLNDDE
ncbi:hypothetical protein P3G55_15360 [Leptospira sp. 96542]|nr:hypothetical protein [Leptospira sp. 96542]